jgi:flagellar biosynthesis protein|tara:strand:- start:2444 stop:2779 length:336 start_codon:yes stop_codon:yes gene_type:complete
LKKISRSQTTKQKKHGKPENSAIAVAIEHRPTVSASLPKIVASGKGNIAERILDIAFAEGVRVRKDADLAEMLAAADIETEIPVEAFIAVAEILRYVYAANDLTTQEVSKS